VAVDEVFTTLCERAYAGEAACLQLIDEAATALAAGLAVLVNALDVDRVVLGGPIWSRISSRILAVLPELIQPQLVAARQPLSRRGLRGRRARRRSGCSGASPRPFPLPAAVRTAHGLTAVVKSSCLN
jgi:predicted NBD/HSP70 family sugar kinase